jgi:hypothetical protein
MSPDGPAARWSPRWGSSIVAAGLPPSPLGLPADSSLPIAAVLVR